MSDTVESLVARFQKLDTDRSELVSRWQEIAEYLQPERAGFFGGKSSSSTDRIKIFDSTPEDALGLLGSALQSLLTSPVHTWFTLGLVSGNTDSSDEVNDWIDEVEKRMIAKFNSEESGFHSAVHEFDLDLPTFGTAGFFVDEMDGIRFQCIPLSEIRASENHKGIIDTVFRDYTMTARQILESWGSRASYTVKEAAEREPDKRFRVIHAVKPRENFKSNSKRSTELPFASYHIEVDSKTMLHESGFYEMPFMVSRWSKTSGDVYGRGIGQKALPDIRVLNAMTRDALIAGEKQADPVTLLPHDGFLGGFSTNGGDLNYYRFQGNPNERVMQLGSQADLNAIMMMIQQKQEAIRKMFLNDKLQMVGGPQMTATEVIAVQNEKMRILGPVLGRLQSEFLAPLINRVFNIMLRNGELPEVPEEMDGEEVRVQYVSPISRAQKQTEAEAFGQALNYLSPVIQMYPQVLDNFDPDGIARDSLPLFGYPNKYLMSADKVKKLREGREQAQARQTQMVQASQEMELMDQAKEVRSADKAV